MKLHVAEDVSRDLLARFSEEWNEFDRLRGINCFTRDTEYDEEDVVVATMESWRDLRHYFLSFEFVDAGNIEIHMPCIGAGPLMIVEKATEGRERLSIAIGDDISFTARDARIVQLEFKACDYCEAIFDDQIQSGTDPAALSDQWTEQGWEEYRNSK